jgi:hypothetical protein
MVLESQLAAVVMRELVRPYESIDDTFVDLMLDDLDLALDEPDEYASYELASVFDVKTAQFVRACDTSRDHVITVEYPRVAVAPDPEPEPAVLPLPLYSVPFERVDIHEAAIDWGAEPTEIVGPPPSRLSLMIAIAAIIAGTLGFGYAIALAM